MSLGNLKGQRTRLVKRIGEAMSTAQDFLLPNVAAEQSMILREDIESQIEILKELQHRFEVLSERVDTASVAQGLDGSEEEGAESMEMVLRMSEVTIKLSSRLKSVEMSSVSRTPSPSSDSVQNQLQRLIDLEKAKQVPQPSNVGSVNLPKLDFCPFSGDVLRWAEFWDSFSATVDANSSLQPVQKLAYLISKLRGEAKAVVSGFQTTNENYLIVVEMLRQRFGDEQAAVTAHYSKIMEIPPCLNHTDKLRGLLDELEQHLRCLSTLGEDVDHRHFISLIMTKLPKTVIIKLEELKGPEVPWSVSLLRSKLQCHLVAREAADRQSTSSSNGEANERRKSYHSPTPPNSTRSLFRDTARIRGDTYSNSSRCHRSTAEALYADDKNSSTEKRKPSCIFCKGSHWSDECRKFATIASRKVQLNGRCFNCLSKDHTIRSCPSDRACWYCKQTKSHHRSLCADKFKAHKEPTRTQKESAHVVAEEKDSESTDESLLVTGERALLQTAIVNAVPTHSNESVSLRLLFDSGSHRTYISEDAAKKLGLKSKTTEFICINTFGAKKSKSVETKIVDFSLKTQDGSLVNIVGNVVPQISPSFQRKPLNLAKYKSVLKGVRLADTFPKNPELSSVDVLIGSDYYLDLLTFEKIPVGDGLHLLGSKFGWILAGRVPTKSSSLQSSSMLILSTVNQSMSSLVEFSAPDKSCPVGLSTEDFWSLETIGIKDSISDVGDEQALSAFKQSVKFEHGRYQVKWPWREEFPCLPSNFELSLGRLKSLLRRLSISSEFLERYDKIIQDQLDKGVIEKVMSKGHDSTLTHYIPHHAVVTPQKTTTKVRIVYDASAKTRKESLSLNECLLRGPVILENLCGLLLRFRLHKFGVVADIKKAFLQVGLQEEDRDVVRFLWLKNASNPTVKDNLQLYRFCRIPFGVISSPFLLAATVANHLQKADSKASNLILNHMYVDNMITGVSSVEELKDLYQQGKSLFTEASMNLREWTSNCTEFFEYLPIEDRCEGITLKVLGMSWNTSSDTLSMSRTVCDSGLKSVTKREIFKKIASFFDPLGFFSPALIRGKILLQEMWQEGLKWDDRLSEDHQTVWEVLLGDFSRLSDIYVPRFVGFQSTEESAKSSLLCFCDASTKAYASVIYLQYRDDAATVRTKLIFSKSRLAPVKRHSIPRLELLAVLIGVRCLQFVESQLHLPITQKILWSDSQCVLHWIKSASSQGVFVNNRLREIRSHTSVSFRYVKGEENPADLPTRGIPVDELLTADLWWFGPKWLNLNQSEWPTWEMLKDGKVQQDSSGPEVLFEASLLTKDDELVCESPFGIHSSKFSTLTRLLKVTAWCKRFVSLCRKLPSDNSNYLKAIEIDSAKTEWDKAVQASCYPEVLNALRNGHKNDFVAKLHLSLDPCGVVRCDDRLRFTELPDSARFPKLLPKNAHFTILIIEHIHKKLLHSGVSQVLAQLRREYWLPQGRRQVHKVLSKCGICKRWEGGPYKLPPMPPFPASRVTKTTSFSYVGIDYFGPLFVKRSDCRLKVWVCLFTCMTVRAIHLELVSDLTAEEFLMSFRRFISRRGTPIQIYSDNGTNFKSASKIVESLWQDVCHDPDVASYCSTAGIQWNFIIQLAPWMGGFYERLIGIVKRCLRKAIGKICLTFVQLQTLLSEVEAVVNSRPLVYVGGEFPTGYPISPQHFLSLNPNVSSTPNATSCNVDLYDPNYYFQFNSKDALLESWKKGQVHLTEFWKQWHEQYLMALRERTQGSMKQPRAQSHHFPTPGDIVLIKDEVLPRASWKIAKILRLLHRSDGQCRGAKVILPSKKQTIRPLALLCPFECSYTPNPISQPVSLPGSDVVPQRDFIVHPPSTTGDPHSQPIARKNSVSRDGSSSIPSSVPPTLSSHPQPVGSQAVANSNSTTSNYLKTITTQDAVAATDITFKDSARSNACSTGKISKQGISKEELHYDGKRPQRMAAKHATVKMQQWLNPSDSNQT